MSSLLHRLSVIRGSIVAVALLLAVTVAVAAGPDFTREIRPILGDHCFNCHGPDAASRKGGLRLDVRGDALRGGKSGEPAIVPGQPDKSALLARILSHDEDEVMPPPKQKKPVSPEKIERLRAWIAAGGKYAEHWAFTAPRRPSGNLDSLIRARQEKSGVQPSPEADRATLLRRLTLDLTGLPPSIAELEAFEKDNKPDAWLRQVDRLLASKHFGERWARWWLDAARYADSDGYEKDLPREQSAWRDWVIEAFNRDLPYDQFVIRQIAGDLLARKETDARAAQDLRVATGFLRNSMVNEEGAIIPEQFRIEAVVDRMDCVGKAVVGLTLSCAQCHDHKFDPVSQREYFQLFAFMNNAHEAKERVLSDTQLKERARIEKEVRAREAKMKSETPAWAAAHEAWETNMLARAGTREWALLTPTHVETVSGLTHPTVQPDGSVLALGHTIHNDVVHNYAETRATNLTGLRVEAMLDHDLPFGGPGRNPNGLFAFSELVVESAPLTTPDSWKAVPLTNATADVAMPDGPVVAPFRKGDDDRRLVGGAHFLIDGNEATAWSPDRHARLRNQPSHAVVQFAQPTGHPEGTRFRVSFKFRHSGQSGFGQKANNLGRWRLSVTTESSPRAEPVPVEVRAALAVVRPERTEAQQNAIFDHWRPSFTAWSNQNRELDELWAQWPEGSSVLNVRERSPDESRTTRLLKRGDWQSPGEPVTPGVPAILPPLPEGAAVDRLAFARWLVDRRSPTAARVLVNRTWQALFGIGFVESPEDFGTRTGTPVYLDAMDWLAVEFMEPSTPGAVPWSFKHLLRTIVASSIYRQDSRATAELLALDPANKLFARGPRFRLEAEMVRDLALSASGLLDGKFGGPSVFPPVPEGVHALSFVPVDFWHTATGPERYCRSLYVFRRRSLPDPALFNFDAPTGDAACVRRERSNTPLAALTSLNETVFAEAAQALGRRILREGGSSDAERLAFAFRLCSGRMPGEVERGELLQLLRQQRARLAKGELRASDIAFSEFTKPAELPADATPNEAAAWTLVARVILNMDATLTKN